MKFGQGAKKNGKGLPEKNLRNGANTLKFHLLDSFTAQQVENRL